MEQTGTAESRGNCRKLPGTVWNRRDLLETAENCREQLGLPGIVGKCREMLGNAGNYRELVRTVRNFRELSEIAGNSRDLMGTDGD